jgi:quercetin dioxygenase-like cupin family protein
VTRPAGAEDRRATASTAEPTPFLIVRDAVRAASPARATGADGVRSVQVISRSEGAVHLSLHVTELDVGAVIDAHVHAHEETAVVLDGRVELWLDGAWHRLEEKCFALVPFARLHAWRNVSGGVARWFTVRAPAALMPLEPAMSHLEQSDVELEEPVREVGAVVPWGPTVGRLSADDQPPFGPLSLGGLGHYGTHVRSISAAMAVDRYRGAVHHTLFTVVVPGRLETPPLPLRTHAHPFEEAFLITDGSTEWELAGVRATAEAGDLVWAGVGTAHAVASAARRPARWIEMQSPAPPAQHGFVFPHEWRENANRSRSTHTRSIPL